MTDTIEKKGDVGQLAGKSPASSHKKAAVVATKIKVYLLEMEDVLFHHDSAVMMPQSPEESPKDEKGSEKQEKVTGVEALALVFKALEPDPKQQIIVAGHADTSGKAKYNFELSEMRAQDVLYLLIGDRDNWAKVSTLKHKVEDYQQIMKYVFKRHKWPCNPGKIDNKWGDITKQATQNFITYYNNEFLRKYNSDFTGDLALSRLPDHLAQQITNDSKHQWPEEMWKAVFNIYYQVLCHILREKPGAFAKAVKDKVKFVDDKNKYVACGESFPIDKAKKKNYRSQENRRVEILIFKEGHAPEIKCPVNDDGSPKWGAVHKEQECPLWHKKVLEPEYLNVKDLYSVTYHMCFRYFDRVKNKVLPVPDGLPIKAYQDGNTERETVVEYDAGSGVYSVKVRFDKPLNELSGIKLHFEFKTPNKWIYTKDKDSDPVIFPEKPEDINELKKIKVYKDITKAEDIAKLRLPGSLNFYDLPAHWSSRNYWTRYKGGDGKDTGERFEKVLADGDKLNLKPIGTKLTQPDKPMTFSLDDIVLIDKDGRQNINDGANTAPKDKDKDDNAVALADNSRFSMFYIKDGDLKLYNPEDADAPYFTKCKFKVNLITDTPQDGPVRLIAFANDFYPVADKRTEANDKFNAAKHVLGCRAARVDDSDWHAGVKHLYTNATWTADPKLHYYYAKITGNFELHYVHDGCLISDPKKVDGLKVRSFLVIYWNGVFEGKTYNYDVNNPNKYEMDPPIDKNNPPKPPADPMPAPLNITNAHLDDFSKKGLKNAKARWESKGYTFEPVNPPKNEGDCIIQVKPVFFFEAKKNNLGGKPKCKVEISNETTAGEMATTWSKMYYKSFADRDYLNRGACDPDFDGQAHETLTVAHELGHAEGKDDEYCYSTSFTSSLFYTGMPYQFDKISMMVYNRVLRMKQLWFFVNWVNYETRASKAGPPPEPAGVLNRFLNGTNLKIVHRFPKRGKKPDRLDYYLASTPRDYRDIYKPAKEGDQNTGTRAVRLALYKMGEDEFSRTIKIKNRLTDFPFDGIIAVFIKISIGIKLPPKGAAGSNVRKKYDKMFNKYKKVELGVQKWNDKAIKVATDWTTGIKKVINEMNNRFYLQTGKNDHDFKNTYIFLFPVTEYNNHANAHYSIDIILNDSDDITRGTPLELGNEVSRHWLANYMLGIDDGKVKAFFRRVLGKDKPGKSNVKFVKTWFDAKLDEMGMDKNFTLKGS